MKNPGHRLLTAALSGAVLLLVPACGGGGGPTQPDPPLRASITTTATSYDRVSFKVVPSRAASVTASYGTTASCGLSPERNGDEFTMTGLRDATTYFICGTAQAAGEAPVQVSATVATTAFPNACTTAWSDIPKDTVTVRVHYDAPHYTTAIIVNFAILCGDSYTVIPKPVSDHILSGDGRNFSRGYLVPRRTHLAVQVGEYLDSGLSRWMDGSEFTLYPRSDSTAAIHPGPETAFTIPSGCAPGNCFDGKVWKFDTLDNNGFALTTGG